MIHDSYFWLLITPPNVIPARGCAQRQSSVLHAWVFARVWFRLILLSAFVVFAFVEEGKGSLVVCSGRLWHADCIKPEAVDSRGEDFKGFQLSFYGELWNPTEPLNGKDTLSAVGRPVTWANMRDICEEIDQMSRRYDNLSPSSSLCSKFLQA